MSAVVVEHFAEQCIRDSGKIVRKRTGPHPDEFVFVKLGDGLSVDLYDSDEAVVCFRREGDQRTGLYEFDSTEAEELTELLRSLPA